MQEADLELHTETLPHKRRRRERKERRKRKKKKLLALKTISVRCEDILEKPRAKALFLGQFPRSPANVCHLLGSRKSWDLGCTSLQEATSRGSAVLERQEGVVNALVATFKK